MYLNIFRSDPTDYFVRWSVPLSPSTSFRPTVRYNSLITESLYRSSELFFSYEKKKVHKKESTLYFKPPQT